MHRRLPLILFVLTAGLVSGVAVSSAAAPVPAPPLPASHSAIRRSARRRPTPRCTSPTPAMRTCCRYGVSASDTRSGRRVRSSATDGSAIDPRRGLAATSPSPSRRRRRSSAGVLSISSNDLASPTRRQLDRQRHRATGVRDASVSFATPRNVPRPRPVTLTNTGNASWTSRRDLDGRRDLHQPRRHLRRRAAPPGDSCSAQIQFLPTTAAPRTRPSPSPTTTAPWPAAPSRAAPGTRAAAGHPGKPRRPCRSPTSRWDVSPRHARDDHEQRRPT